MDPRVKIIYTALLKNYGDIKVNYKFRDIKFKNEMEFAEWVVESLEKETHEKLNTITIIDVSKNKPTEIWAGDPPHAPQIFRLNVKGTE